MAETQRYEWPLTESQVAFLAAAEAETRRRGLVVIQELGERHGVTVTDVHATFSAKDGKTVCVVTVAKPAEATA